MNSLQDIWNSIIGILSSKLTPTSIKTWFEDCTPVALNDGTLILHTTTELKRSILQQRFEGEIKEALREIFSCDFEILILAGDEEYEPAPDINPLPEMDGYTFENFIVGKCNEFAYAAAKGVVKNPGNKVYNPLFIYGNSGLGKTHLLCAIGTSIHENRPEAKIAYIKGDDFTNEMVRSLKEGTADEFRQKYRGVDLFLVDDIQFIAGKEATQEEFFHTFNSIYEAGHQIVITSDRPPIDMLRLDDRLRTRFEGGVMADVAPPDLETRMAIIRNKAAQFGMVLSDEVISYIAENITSNVRQIEGTLNRIAAFSDLLGSEPDEESVTRAIKEIIERETVPSAEIIIHHICKYYNIDEDTIRGKSQNHEVANARQIAMYLIRRMTKMTLTDIGRAFGGKDHATVLYSLNKVEKQINTDPSFKETINEITANINARH